MEEMELQPPVGVDESGETETYPLDNPVVLGRLFDLIPFQLEDFKSFRSVSRAWNQCSLSTWRKNAWLLLRDKKSAPMEEEYDSDYEDVDFEDVDDESVDLDEDIDVNSDIDAKVKGITRQRYLHLLQNDQHQLSQHPFRKFTIRRCNIDLQFVNHDGVLRTIRFWNRVGALMTHLDFTLCDFARVADFRTLIFEATPNLRSLTLIFNFYTDKRPKHFDQRLDPNLPQNALIPLEQVRNSLVELNIKLASGDDDGETDEDDDDNSEEGGSWVEYLPITWMELFIHFPNIKKFGQLQLIPDKVDKEVFECFMSLEKLKRTYGPHYLAGLRDLDLFFYDGLIVRLNLFLFPLQRLTLCIRPNLEVETFRKLLDYPLEYLCVDQEGATRPYEDFPFGLQFPALKELILIGHVVPNLMFLKECPNLERLKYTPYYEGHLDVDLKHVLSDEKLPRLEKMKSLEIDGDGCSAVEIMKLGEIMPNLRSLEVGLDNESFRAVCRVWKELEQLNIAPFRVGEEGLLGMDERGGEKFRHPNLTDLKNLKMFKMEDIKMSQDRRGLTNAAISEEIMTLPSLEVVDLCLSSEVTLEVRNKLGKRFPKCSISIQERPQGGNQSAAFAAAAQLERKMRMEAL